MIYPFLFDDNLPRYIDDVLITFNGPEAALKAILKKANNHHLNIKLKAIIASSVPFLDLLISNNNGILSTSVYQKPAVEPCVVSFISDHSRYVFSNVIHAALLRAVRYSSTLEIFEKERRAIRLMLLYNGSVILPNDSHDSLMIVSFFFRYPIRYIDTYLRKFLAEYISSASITPLIDDKNQFFTMRNTLLARPSVRELQVNHGIANAGLSTTTNNQDEHNNTSRPKKVNKFDKTLFLHCTHEKRLDGLKRDIHKIYADTFQGSPAMDVRLIVGHRNHRNTKSELIQKRPDPALLKPKPLPSTF